MKKILSQHYLIVTADDKPKMIVPLKRLGIPVTLKALTGKQVFKVRERNTRTIERRNKTEKVLDTEGFNTGLIVAATVKPNGVLQNY